MSFAPNVAVHGDIAITTDEHGRCMLVTRKHADDDDFDVLFQNESLMPEELAVAIGQAVEICEYVEGHAKGAMVDRVKKYLSLPFAQHIAHLLRMVRFIEAAAHPTNEFPVMRDYHPGTHHEYVDGWNDCLRKVFDAFQIPYVARQQESSNEKP